AVTLAMRVDLDAWHACVFEVGAHADPCFASAHPSTDHFGRACGSRMRAGPWCGVCFGTVTCATADLQPAHRAMAVCRGVPVLPSASAWLTAGRLSEPRDRDRRAAMVLLVAVRPRDRRRSVQLGPAQLFHRALPAARHFRHSLGLAA